MSLIDGHIVPTPTKPTLGRIVHYTSLGTPGGEYLPESRAAIVTEVGAVELEGGGKFYMVCLCVLNPTGMFFNRMVPFSEEPKPGHWNWPPQV